MLYIIIPQPGLPEGVLTFSNKECLQVALSSGSPVMRRAVPPAPGGPVSQVDIQTKVRKFQEITKISGRDQRFGGIETGS